MSIIYENILGSAVWFGQWHSDTFSGFMHVHIYRHFQSQSGEIGHGHGGNVAQERIVHLGLVVLAAAVLKIMIIVGLVLQFGHNQLINQQN